MEKTADETGRFVLERQLHAVMESFSYHWKMQKQYKREMNKIEKKLAVLSERNRAANADITPRMVSLPSLLKEIG